MKGSPPLDEGIIYDSVRNSRLCYDDGIAALRERLERSRVVIGNCTLYNEDCRFILPTLGRVDAVVTDPPYGIGEGVKCAHRTIGRKERGRWQKRARTDYEKQTWDDEPASPKLISEIRKKSEWQIIFGGNFYDLPSTHCWLVWDKQNGASDFADCELAWTNLKKPVRRLAFLWNGFQRAHGEQRGDHPTQKPVGVMKWCIEHLPDDVKTILDPFSGSGTTGVAAVKLGKSFIGIERDRKYFDVMCRRIEAAYAQPDMFVQSPEKPPEQLSCL